MENTLSKDANFRYIRVLPVKPPDANGLCRSVRGLGVEKLRRLKRSVSAVCVVYMVRSYAKMRPREPAKEI